MTGKLYLVSSEILEQFKDDLIVKESVDEVIGKPNP